MSEGRRDVVLVYRDRIVPRSEAQFLRRQYVGFERLAPVWIGCRRDAGVGELGTEPLILGRDGALGALDRFLFKQFGVLPRAPDLAALRPRAVHAHFGRGGALALPIARRLGIPLVVTFHGGDAGKDKHYEPRLVPTIFQRRLAALKDEAAAIICVSEHVARRLAERGFPEAKLRVVRYGVEVVRMAAEPPPQPRPYLLFVGRFVEKKGIAVLLEAMRKLDEKATAPDLVLIGDGPLADALRAGAAGLQRVHFRGWLPPAEVRRWMRGAIAVCVPSIEAGEGDAEGLPNVVLEAMAEGAPVIGSHHAGIGEAVEDGRTGLLVPAGDAGALAAAAERLADDRMMRAAMGEAGRAAALERFDAVAQSRLLEETLLAAIAANRK